MSRKLLLSLFFIFLFAQSIPAFAQISSDGADFMILNPATDTNGIATIIASSYSNNRIYLSSFDQFGIEHTVGTYSISALSSKSVAIPSSAIVGPDSLPRFRLWHLTSDSAVSVQVYYSLSDRDDDRMESSLAIPTLALGRSYQVASYPSVIPNPTNQAVHSASSEFFIEGIYDSTKIYVQPTAPTSNTKLLNSITLSRGQVLWVRVPDTVGGDLSGTSIQSNKPIGVISGHELAQLPNMLTVWPQVGDDLQNPLIEQIRPLKDWDGSGYVSIPFYWQKVNGVPSICDGDLFRVYSGSKQTQPQSLQNIANPFHFVSAKPIDVMQLGYYRGQLLGKSIPTVGYGAPIMSSLIPISRWQTRTIFNIPLNSFLKGGQYINIIGDKSGLDNMKFYYQRSLSTPNIIATYNIPDYPKLEGITVRANAGDYAIFCNAPFVAYSYGNVVGQYKGCEAYAAPCGFMSSPDSSLLKIDTLCSGWKGIFFQYGVDNSHFLEKLTLHSAVNTKLRSISGDGDTAFLFTISVIDSSKDASADLYVSGLLFAHFVYTAPRIEISRDKTIISGSSDCIPVVVRNITSKSFSVDTLSIVGATGIAISSSSLPLPAELAPGDSVVLNLCYSSSISDTALFYTLKLMAGCVEFDYSSSDASNTAITQCGMPDTMRVWLTNKNANNLSEVVTNTYLTGPDAADFTIVGNQFNYTPLANFPLDAGETMWIDVAFTPDMTRPAPARWQDRLAALVAENSLHTDPEIQLIGHIIFPAISGDRSSLDLGHVTIGATGQATLTITDTGNAPVVIESVTIGNAKIVVSGLAAGDTLEPGQSRTITLTGVSQQADSIATMLTVVAQPSCAPVLEVPVTFVASPEATGGTHRALSKGFAFPAGYTCTHSTGVSSFANTGSDTITLVSVEIIGGPEFTFAHGMQFISINQPLAADSLYTVSVNWSPTSSGAAAAIVRYTWDSSGMSVTSDAPLSASASVAQAALAVSTPVVLTNIFPGSMMEVPVIMTLPPPAALGATNASVTLRYRRDLFQYQSAASTYGTPQVTRTVDANDNELLRITLQSAAGFSGTELARVSLQIMVALDTSTVIDIANAIFTDASADSLCVSYTEQPTQFKEGDRCGDNLTRIVMEKGMLPISILSIVPNPNSGILRVTVEERQNQAEGPAPQWAPATRSAMRFTLVNVLGQTVYSMERQLGQGVNTVDLDLVSVPTGSYMLVVSDGIAQSRQRVEVAR
jgi:hypothetical protein